VLKEDSKSSEIIKIGQVSSLSSVGSDIGVEERNGALLALEEINAKGGIKDKQLEMISEDSSEDKIRNAASVFQKLVNVDKVIGIVGPQWDGSGTVAVSMSKELKVPVISPNVSPQVEKDVNSEYFFSNFYSNEVGIQVLLEFAKEKGYKNIAIVQPANVSFWEYTSRLFRENAPDYGITVVSEEYGTDFLNSDYKTIITKAKQKNPDALFGSYSDLECSFLKQAKGQGLNVPLLSTESAGNPKVLKDCPEVLEESLYYSTPKQYENYKDFESKYEKRFGTKPLSPTAVTAYDAMMILVQAIENADSLDRQSVRNELEKIEFKKGYSMPEIKFDELGFVITNKETFTVKTVKNAEFVDAE
jgi:branched-chain amino acid transport system substrate-binding protein